MAAKRKRAVHWLFHDMRVKGAAEPRVFKERYSSLDEAKAQAEHDLEGGFRRILRIEDAKGKTVWEP